MSFSDLERAVCAALTSRGISSDRMMAAALHLATPATEVVGIHVRRDGDQWVWRDLSVPAVDITASGAAGTAVSAACLGWADGDAALPVADGPQGWVKPHLSGSRIIAYGTELLGGPVVAGEPSTPEHVLRSVAAVALLGDVTPPAILEADGSIVLVEGDASYWMVRSSTGNPRSGADPLIVEHPLLDPGDDDVAGVADWLGAELGGIAVARQYGSRVAGTIDIEVHVTLAEGWQARVPAVVAVGAELIGIAVAEAVGAGVSVSAPGGYEVEGVLSSGEVLATHTRSGLRVALRRS